MQIRVQFVKVKYLFPEKNQEISGIELRFAPKVKKFMYMNKDTKELLDLVGNGLAQWYDRADYGDDIIVGANFPDNPREKVVVPVEQEPSVEQKIDTSDFWK